MAAKLHLLLPDERALAGYVARQISNFFPDRDVSGEEVLPYVETGLTRLEGALEAVRDKYFAGAGKTPFNHRHTDHYAMFLYLVANSVFRSGGPRDLAEKAYALNKALHGLDVFYEVQLPEIFFFQHPVGTVLGRARYADYLIVYQRCSTGAKDGVYPVLGAGVVMFGGSAVLGDCVVGDNVWLSAGTLIMGENIPPNSAVFGQSPRLVVKPTRRDAIRDLFLRNVPADAPSR